MMEKKITADEIKDSTLYFICSSIHGLSYYSEWKSGKRGFSVKPGIAIRYVGSQEVRDFLIKNPNLFAMAVPKNADKKWKRRV